MISSATTPTYDAERIRAQIPRLREEGAPAPVYLDNASTTLMPQQVLDAWTGFYARCGGSAGRGGHPLSVRAEEELTAARRTVRRFLGAADDDWLVFTRNATEALNLAAWGLRACIEPGDVLGVSGLEHHSNDLPWRRIARERHAVLSRIPVREDGGLNLEWLEEIADDGLRVVAVTSASNVTGHQPELARISALTRAAGAFLVVDATQSAAHEGVSFQASGADLAAVSAHKMMGPTGIGALVVRAELAPRIEPLLVGGGMVQTVGSGETSSSRWSDGLSRLEAGTHDSASAVAWAAACKWLEGIGKASIHAHESALATDLRGRLGDGLGVRFLPDGGRGSPSITTFVSPSLHAHDVAHVLSRADICVRSGHMCAQPLLADLGVASVTRVSVAPYSTRDDINRLVSTLARVLHTHV